MGHTSSLLEWNVERKTVSHTCLLQSAGMSELKDPRRKETEAQEGRTSAQGHQGSYLFEKTGLSLLGLLLTAETQPK